MSKVLITVSGGQVNVVHSSDDVDVTVVYLDLHEQYLYKDQICEVIEVNDDGTVDLRVIETINKTKSSRRIIGVPSEDISIFGSADELDDWDDEEDEDW